MTDFDALKALAGRVAAGDPERFRAAMTAPDAERPWLLALYAWALETARAPWSANEPALAEMRLQWRRDAIEAMYRGESPPADGVSPFLAEAIRAARLPMAPFLAYIDARARDIEPEPPRGRAMLGAYIEATGGGLMALAARILSPDEGDALEPIAADAGFAQGAARLILAIPELAARGRAAMPEAGDVRRILKGENTPELSRSVNLLAEEGLRRLEAARKRRNETRSAKAAFLPAVFAEAILKAAARPGVDVFHDALQPSEFARRWRMLRAGLGGGW